MAESAESNPLHNPGEQLLPIVIGWKERIDFVDWGLRRIKVKIDTGARTSALDAVNYEIFEDRKDGPFARLQVALDRRHPDRVAVVEAPLIGMIVVRNSAGVCEERPVIKTRIHMGLLEKVIALTVTRRPGMLFRVLLGRAALAPDFVVDVARKYLLKKFAKSPSP